MVRDTVLSRLLMRMKRGRRKAGFLVPLTYWSLIATESCKSADRVCTVQMIS